MRKALRDFVLWSALCGCASGTANSASMPAPSAATGSAGATDSQEAAAPTDSSAAFVAQAQGIEDGGAPALDDAEGGSAGSGDSQAACDSTQIVALPAQGDLLVTEVMFDPSGAVPDAQWFEVYNTTSVPELLSGLTIFDGYSNAHVIASQPPVIAPPGAYVLLVRDRATADAASVPDSAIVYEYGAGLASNDGIKLATDSTGDLSLWNDTSQIVDVPYGSWGMASVGQSIELSILQSTAEGQGSSWCIAQVPWAPGADDGTPGAVSDCP
jgi:hypothetical protein